ncbi:Sulfate transporter [Trichophyton interdigitale]|uniref:Sulfate transporter n=1 Tax=Trichophyton interdigitale TaxID=101480 RepID=A0A9P4YFJ2_9EURO|nr:Sulfate transporter [Trichophyton interdigitale]KAF3895249.1 Sulfate transporter [Trichophyton interdigitale]KAG8208723.1 Sulfate transporter [Trichophyton interdigitale]
MRSRMRIRHFASQNWQTFRERPLAEISGAVGDLGTFLPILIALTINNSISLPSTLVFSGIWNILTGLFFGIPLPVQPMKAIAAVAIAGKYTAGQVAAAGLFVAICILLFSVTGALRWFSGVVPIPVVKGIQVGAGLSLVVSAGVTLKGSLSWIQPSWADNYIWMIAAFVGLVITNVYRRIPYGLSVFILGLVFAIIRLAVSEGGILPGFRFWRPWLTLPSPLDWKTGILDAGVGQVPLTTLNSVIAVVHLAADLLPDIPTPTVTEIGLSVAAMNLIGIWFGSMPVCHGSGGLAAQYRFGARSGASVIFLGFVKVVVGLLFGNTIVNLLAKFPVALLSVMVIAAGLELASVGESLNTSSAWDLRSPEDRGILTGPISGASLDTDERKKRWTVMIVTVGVLVAFKNDGLGFIAGMLCHWTYGIPAFVDQLRSRFSRGRVRLPTHS